MIIVIITITITTTITTTTITTITIITIITISYNIKKVLISPHVHPICAPRRVG